MLTLSVALAVTAAPLLPAATNNVTGPRSGEWAHVASPLAPDPKVIWGRLDNGFRYALLPYRGVPGRVATQLIVLSGSIDESNAERGIAHYTEHMVFRTTKNFSFDEKLKFFRSLGMEFGSDVSATTTYEHTDYVLEFHNATPELLSQGMRVFRDFADGATFLDSEINQERGVILSERRDRNSVDRTTYFDAWRVQLKGLPYGEHTTIGLESTLRSFQREHFLRFYERCYRPDLMVLVAAGDFDPAQFATLVQERFGDMRRPEAPIPGRDVGRLDMSKGLRAGLLTVADFRAPRALVSCTSMDNGRPDSAEVRLEVLRRQLAMRIVSERLQQAIGPRGEGAYETIFGVKNALLAANISSDDWARELGVMDDLIRFTAQRGFEQRELDYVRRPEIVRLGYLLEQKDTLDPTNLVKSLASSIHEHKVYTGFEASLRWNLENMNRVTVRDLHREFQAMWDVDRMTFHLTGDLDIEGGPAEIVKKVLEDRKGGLRRFRSETRKESVFELRKWGTATELIETTTVPELGAKLMRFGNNVRVNFVPNRSAAGIVRIVARFGNGLLDMPDHRPALKDFGLRTILAGGTGGYNPEQIGQVLSDHFMDFSFDLDDQDAFAFRAAIASDKADMALGLITDFLARPLFGTATHREVKGQAFMERSMGSLGKGEAMRELSEHLFRGDPRLTWGGPNDYIGLSAIDTRNWLEDPLKRSYLEVTIVGDITEEQLMVSLNRTLACLPVRDVSKTLFAKPRPVKVVAPAGYERIEYLGETHKALVVGSWPIQARLEFADRITLQVLARSLRDRAFAKIRSELGLAYGPHADIDLFDGFPDFALVQAFVECDPADASKIARLLSDIGTDLAREGISPSEFIGARGILRSQIDSAYRNGSFLITVLSRAQEDPGSVANAVALKGTLLESISDADVNAWAARILTAPNCRTVALVPKPFIGVFSPSQ